MYELNSLTYQSVNSKLHVNINDSWRVSCGKTSCSLNSHCVKTSWFWLNMEIITIRLHLKQKYEWRETKGEESIGGSKKESWLSAQEVTEIDKGSRFRQSSLLVLDHQPWFFCHGMLKPLVSWKKKLYFTTITYDLLFCRKEWEGERSSQKNMSIYHGY